MEDKTLGKCKEYFSSPSLVLVRGYLVNIQINVFTSSGLRPIPPLPTKPPFGEALKPQKFQILPSSQVILERYWLKFLYLVYCVIHFPSSEKKKVTKFLIFSYNARKNLRLENFDRKKNWSEYCNYSFRMASRAQVRIPSEKLSRPQKQSYRGAEPT